MQQVRFKQHIPIAQGPSRHLAMRPDARTSTMHQQQAKQNWPVVGRMEGRLIIQRGQSKEEKTVRWALQLKALELHSRSPLWLIEGGQTQNFPKTTDSHYWWKCNSTHCPQSVIELSIMPDEKKLHFSYQPGEKFPVNEASCVQLESREQPYFILETWNKERTKY